MTWDGVGVASGQVPPAWVIGDVSCVEDLNRVLRALQSTSEELEECQAKRYVAIAEVRRRLAFKRSLTPFLTFLERLQGWSAKDGGATAATESLGER